MSQLWYASTPAETNVWDDDLDRIADMLATLKSNFSGTAAPSNAVEGMWWADTDDNILKIYDGASWQNVFNFSTMEFYIGSGYVTAAMISDSARKPSLVTGQTINPTTLQINSTTVNATAAEINTTCENVVANVKCESTQNGSAASYLEFTGLTAGVYQLWWYLSSVADSNGNHLILRVNNTNQGTADASGGSLDRYTVETGFAVDDGNEGFSLSPETNTDLNANANDPQQLYGRLDIVIPACGETMTLSGWCASSYLYDNGFYNDIYSSNVKHCTYIYSEDGGTTTFSIRILMDDSTLTGDAYLFELG